MRGLLIVSLSAIALLCACVEPLPRRTAATPTSEAPPTAVVVPPALPTTTPSPVEPDSSQSPATTPPATPPNSNASVALPNPPPAAISPAKAAPPSPKQSSIPPTTAAAVPAPVERPSSPTLDLAGLEQRLRDTHAIGVFTKLSIKNQVSDLLEEFREFHDGKLNLPLAELRQRYEQLLLEVITLLQDADQPLATAVASSREAIWGVLVDPKTFAKI